MVDVDHVVWCGRCGTTFNGAAPACPSCRMTSRHATMQPPPVERAKGRKKTRARSDQCED